MKFLNLSFLISAMGLFGLNTVSAESNVKVIKEPLKVETIQWVQAPSALPQERSVEITWTLAPEHHAYLDQFKLEVLEPQSWPVAIQEITPVVDFHDSFSKKIKKGVKSSGRLIAVVEVPEAKAEQFSEVKWRLTYQACTKDFCHLPKKIELSLPWAQQSSPQPSSDASLFGSFDDKGFWQILLIVFIAGMATSLTPCIFPMIPITLAVLGARDGRSPRSSFGLSLSYVFGIAVTYSLLGLGAALSGKLFGSLLSNVWVVGSLSLLFMAFGWSMMGAFSLEFPPALQTKLRLHKTQHGWLGAFMAGNLAGVVAGPCVGPVLAGVLTYVAQTQDWRLGFIYLFTFAFGLGQLFLWLGTFSQIKNWVPRSGPWMESVKYLLGLIMQGLAFYYLKPLLSDLYIWALVSLWLGTLAIYFIRKRDELVWAVLGRLSVALMLIWALLLALMTFSPGARNYLGWGSDTQRAEANYAKLPWRPFSDDELLKAQEQGLPVVIDFYADWCAACKELEAFTFSDGKVQSYKDQFIWLKFDATTTNEEFDRLQQRYQIVGLPHLTFIDSKGRWQQELTLTGFESADLFEKRLQSLLSFANSR